MKLSDITHGVVERPARIILCGVEKIGKSTFASQSPDPIFIPVKMEEGIDDLDVARFPVAESFDQVVEAIGSLCEEEHKFKTVIIDSLSTLEPLVWEKVCKDHQATSIEKVLDGFGKGYVEAVKCWRDVMAGIDWLRENKGMGCILISHVVVKTFNNPDGGNYDCYEPDINKKALSALLRWSDAVLFANSKVFTKIEGKGSKETKKGVMTKDRVLYTLKHPAHPGGGRGVLGRLPAELDLNYEAWQKAIEAAKEQ